MLDNRCTLRNAKDETDESTVWFKIVLSVLTERILSDPEVPPGSHGTFPVQNLAVKSTIDILKKKWSLLLKVFEVLELLALLYKSLQKYRY